MLPQQAYILVAPDVATHSAKFFEIQTQGVERSERAVRYSVADLSHIAFVQKRSEQTIPNNQHPAQIALHLAGNDAVMYPMVRRRVEYGLDPGRQAIDDLGVDEEVIGKIEIGRQNGRHLVEAKQSKR